ncbi:MAG: hypothetical protein ACK417_11390 [Bacteroidia bacterium]
MKKLVLVLMLVFGSAWTGQEVMAQCPMCKTSLESNRKDNEKAVGNGINNGILYLLAMPFIAVGSVAGLYIYRQRKA